MKMTFLELFPICTFKDAKSAKKIDQFGGKSKKGELRWVHGVCFSRSGSPPRSLRPLTTCPRPPSPAGLSGLRSKGAISKVTITGWPEKALEERRMSKVFIVILIFIKDPPSLLTASKDLLKVLMVSKDLTVILIVLKDLPGVLIDFKYLPVILIVIKDILRILTVLRISPRSSSTPRFSPCTHRLRGSPQDPHHFQGSLQNLHHHHIPFGPPINL